MPFRENIPEKKKVKRPANNWMLFRKAFISHFRAQIKGTPEERKHPGTKLSRFASNAWDKGGEELKSFWAQKAEEEKRAHEKANPGYKYRPMKKADKERAKLEEQLLKNKLKEEQKRATNGKRGKGKSLLSLRGAEGYQRCSSDEVIDNFGAVEHPGPVRHNARTSPYPYYRSPTKYGGYESSASTSTSFSSSASSSSFPTVPSYFVQWNSPNVYRYPNSSCSSTSSSTSSYSTFDSPSPASSWTSASLPSSPASPVSKELEFVVVEGGTAPPTSDSYRLRAQMGGPAPGETVNSSPIRIIDETVNFDFAQDTQSLTPLAAEGVQYISKFVVQPASPNQIASRPQLSGASLLQHESNLVQSTSQLASDNEVEVPVPLSPPNLSISIHEDYSSEQFNASTYAISAPSPTNIDDTTEIQAPHFYPSNLDVHQDWDPEADLNLLPDGDPFFQEDVPMYNLFEFSTPASQFPSSEDIVLPDAKVVDWLTAIMPY